MGENEKRAFSERRCCFVIGWTSHLSTCAWKRSTEVIGPINEGLRCCLTGQSIAITITQQQSRKNNGPETDHSRIRTSQALHESHSMKKQQYNTLSCLTNISIQLLLSFRHGPAKTQNINHCQTKNVGKGKGLLGVDILLNRYAQRAVRLSSLSVLRWQPPVPSTWPGYLTPTFQSRQ